MKRELTLLLESQPHFYDPGPASGSGPGSLGRTRSSKRLKVSDCVEGPPDNHRGALDPALAGSRIVVPEIAKVKSRNTAASIGAAAKGPKEEPVDILDDDSSARSIDPFTRPCLKPGIGGDLGFKSVNPKPDVVMTEAANREEFQATDPRIKSETRTYKGRLSIAELLKTGLLDGLSVTYKGYGVRGVIKDSGILCPCKLCEGQSVVSPSKFELHVRHVYMNAAQYLYLENGKNIARVLKECRGTSFDKLEETIRNAVGPLPEKNISKVLKECGGTSLDKFETKSQDSVGSLPGKKSIICQDCKGSLSTLPGSTGDSSCCSCMKLKIPLANPTQTIATGTRPPEPVLTPKSYEGASASNSSKSKNELKITKKYQLLHRLVFEEGGLPDGTELAYYGRGQKLLEGYKKGSGIFCFCCNLEVSPSAFEAHAGWASRKKPYQYIYTSNGVSLHELSLSLSKVRKFAAKDSDDVCIICADGGNLLLCDGCPRAFHKDCASLTSIPGGSWYCKYCQNMFEKDKYLAYNANAVAAGRVSGVDSIEQITKRCIRIFKNPEAGGNVCILCRGYDNQKSEFGRSTVMLCDQCGMEYHVGCLKDHKMADLRELPKGKWFCCMDCRRIHSILQKLLVRGAERLPDSLLNIIKKKDKEKGSSGIQVDIRWRLLSGKMTSPEAKLLLSKAVSIFHGCFDPIIEPETGRDLIPCMVYGRNTKSHDFEGMYCAILTADSTIVTAGVLRILGQGVAEIPLVATTKDNHGKGYFQTLFSCIERLLAFSKVKTLVLPAADEAISIWTDKFGFKKILPYQLSNYHKNGFNLMMFQGTSMLHKSVPKCQIIPKS